MPGDQHTGYAWLLPYITHLGSNLCNFVQSVHHVVQQLQFVLCEAAEEQRARGATRLDDAGYVLQNQQASQHSKRQLAE